jgi:hypothetical protein
MHRAKLGPERAQTKCEKSLYFLVFFATFARLLALAALRVASVLRAPLAKIGQKPLVLLLF